MLDLYLISDGGKLRQVGRLIDSISAALDGAGGLIKYVQLREQVPLSNFPLAKDDEVINIGNRLLPICKKNGAKLIISRRPDLCERIGADGVHLGANTMNVRAVREIIGPSGIVGYSAHSREEALEAAKQRINYLFLSPIFSPISKTSNTTPLGIKPLEKLVSSTKIPVFALGGIDKSNISKCEKAQGVAVIGSILLQDDPKEAAKNLASAISKKP